MLALELIENTPDHKFIFQQYRVTPIFELIQLKICHNTLTIKILKNRNNNEDMVTYQPKEDIIFEKSYSMNKKFFCKKYNARLIHKIISKYIYLQGVSK